MELETRVDSSDQTKDIAEQKDYRAVQEGVKPFAMEYFKTPAELPEAWKESKMETGTHYNGQHQRDD